MWLIRHLAPASYDTIRSLPLTTLCYGFTASDLGGEPGTVEYIAKSNSVLFQAISMNNSEKRDVIICSNNFSGMSPSEIESIATDTASSQVYPAVSHSSAEAKDRRRARARADRQIVEDLAASGKEWDAASRYSTSASILGLTSSGESGKKKFFHLSQWAPGETEIEDLATISFHTVPPAWIPDGWQLSAAPDYAPSVSYLISGDLYSLSSKDPSPLYTAAPFGDSFVVNKDGGEKQLIFDQEGTMRAKFLNMQACLEKKLQDAVNGCETADDGFHVADWWQKIIQHQNSWVFPDIASEPEITAMLAKCEAIWTAFPKKASLSGHLRPWTELDRLEAEWPAKSRVQTWWEYVTRQPGAQDQENLRHTCYANIVLTVMLLCKHGTVNLDYSMRRALAELLQQACRSGRLYMKDYYHRIHPMSDSGLYDWTPRMRESFSNMTVQP